MPTTIQVTKEIKAALDRLKIFKRETYNDVIERLLEDLSELNDDTIKEIDMTIEQVKKGKSISHEDLGKEMGF